MPSPHDEHDELLAKLKRIEKKIDVILRLEGFEVGLLLDDQVDEAAVQVQIDKLKASGAALKAATDANK